MQYNPEQISANKFLPHYDVYIEYYRQARNNKSDEISILTVRITGEKPALKFFKELVQQIREQLPDQIYLDKMLDDILSGGKDIHDEHGETKVPGVRAKKSRGKNLLRAASTSYRGRRR